MRLTVLLVFLLGMALGSRPHAAQRAAESGRIAGGVFHQGTGDPIADVLITVNSVTPAPASGAAAGTNPAPAPRTSYAGRDGRFMFDAVRPGDYTVRAQLEGYFSAEDTGGGTALPAPIVRATVVAGQTRDVRFTMIPGGTISGRVNSMNGPPVTGAQLQAYRMGYLPDGSPQLQLIGNRTTDDRGEFRLFHLPPGAYYIAAGSLGVIPLMAAARGRGATGPARTLYPSALDIGEARQVTLASGEEIEGVNIDMRSATFAKVSGRVFSSLPDSAYVAPPPTVTPRGADPAVANVDKAALEAALAALETLRAQRGQPGTAGAAVVQPPAAQLQLVPRDRRALVDPGISRTVTAAMAPQNNGYFELESVPPGSYVLYASLPDNTGGGAGQTGTGVIARAFGRAAFDVGTTDVSDIAITIHHGVDVIGQVYTDVDISTLKGMRVSVQPDDSAARIGLYQQVGGYQAEVGETGAFKIPILPEAMYRVQMTFGGGPSASRAFILGVRQEGADIFDSGFLVGDKPVAPIEIFVSAKSGSVTGTALDAQGRPAPNAVVALVPPAERRHNPTLFRTATANAEGKFTLTGVPPGEFKLFAWRSIPTGANRNPAFIARYENSGMPVTIAADGELRVDATLAVPNP